MIKIILVRHGQTIKNKAGLAQGHADSDLTKEGMSQLEKTRDFLKDYKIDVAFSSNLKRAIKTAEVICEYHNIEHIIDDNLKELSWGDFAVFSTDQLLKKWSEYYEIEKAKGVPIKEIRPKKGENTSDHILRVKKVIDRIIKKYKNKTVLIVAHGGTNKVLVGLLKNVDLDDFYKIKQDNACINFLELDNNGKLVDMKLNLIEHLE